MGVIQALVYLAVGLAVGVRLETGAAGAVVLLVFAVLICIGFGALGAFAALRTGSGEAVQSLFPVFFVFLFLSSMAMPRNLIEIDWFRTVATANPVSYLIECIRSLIIVGWDAEALSSGSGSPRDRRRRRGAGEHRAPHEAGALMRALSVAQGVAWRTLHNVFTNPSLLIPSLIFPLFFFVAFAGGLSQVNNVPGFDFPLGYTAFQFVFVLLQSAAFGGVFTGFGIARDFETGFARRLLLAAPNRTGIILGYAAAALVRWLVTAAVLTIVALAVGMEVGGERSRSRRALHARAPHQHRGRALGVRRSDAAADDAGGAGDADAGLPRPLLRAGVRPAGAAPRLDPTVATVNPVTRVLEAGRGLLAGSPTEVGVAFAVVSGSPPSFRSGRFSGLRNAENAG